jgi:hypothetical protein
VQSAERFGKKKNASENYSEKNRKKKKLGTQKTQKPKNPQKPENTLVRVSSNPTTVLQRFNCVIKL